jgi:hypothetical protein
LDPNDTDFYVARGKAHLGMKNRDAALADFNHAVTLRPQLTDDVLETIRAYDHSLKSK